MSTCVTVAEYLKQRLEEIGCEHIFGVAGNYSAAFLNTIEQDPNTSVSITGNTNEINAGHCADGYARVSGKMAVVCVTYGVGAFSLLNPILGAQNLKINQPDGFVCAAAWLSIGYSVPASLGVKFAAKNKRPLVFVGDGSFQETCQAVSGHYHYKTNIVVFVLNNHIYGIEQMLVNPNPFRPEDTANPDIKKREYADPLLNTIYPYNELNVWSYEKIVDMVGGTGFVVENRMQLKEVLEKIDTLPDINIVVNVKIPKTDVPDAIRYKFAGTGEDEYESSTFPPFCPPL